MYIIDKVFPRYPLQQKYRQIGTLKPVSPCQWCYCLLVTGFNIWYLVLLRSLFVGWFSILSHFSNKIYLSALRVTACLFSVEIIPIDTKKRKMPESLVFTSSALAGCGVGRLGHSGGRNDETSQEPPSFLSQEILNLKQNVFLFLFELEIAVLILTDDRGTQDIKLTKNRAGWQAHVGDVMSGNGYSQH